MGTDVIELLARSGGGLGCAAEGGLLSEREVIEGTRRAWTALAAHVREKGDEQVGDFNLDVFIARMALAGVKIDSFGGACPLQAEGTMCGGAFYLRSRWDTITFEWTPRPMSKDGENPAVSWSGEGVPVYLEDDSFEGIAGASWIEYADAAAYLERAFLAVLWYRKAESIKVLENRANKRTVRASKAYENAQKTLHKRWDLLERLKCSVPEEEMRRSHAAILADFRERTKLP